mmetsp:Transcript_52648/g.120003  ORF Transcript_52648/g.120003 Transcript_52648/m.120003 type:complete len:170 (-) Transcript_52648:117-626(-)
MHSKSETITTNIEKICRNILNDPGNAKFRSLRKEVLLRVVHVDASGGELPENPLHDVLVFSGFLSETNSYTWQYSEGSRQRLQGLVNAVVSLSERKLQPEEISLDRVLQATKEGRQLPHIKKVDDAPVADATITASSMSRPPKPWEVAAKSEGQPAVELSAEAPEVAGA